jgi:N-acetylglucosaminyldiphosphoundecaprenol N-acetyl-beta-D-mannosaminyltransferase
MHSSDHARPADPEGLQDKAQRKLAHHDILGFDLAHLDAADAIALFIDWAARAAGGYVCVPNAHVLVAAQKDTALALALREARLLLPDSMIVQKARAVLYGAPPPHTLFGADLMEGLCARAAQHAIPIGLHGGADETLHRLRLVLLSRWPSLQIAHAESPPFGPVTPEAAAAAGQRIAASGARLVFVGLGAPKQEVFMQAASPHMPASLAIGVGAAFDAIAGVTTRPPDWLHRSGLTWAFRLAQEPDRLWRRYLHTSPVFAWAILRQKLAQRRAHNP